MKSHKSSMKCHQEHTNKQKSHQISKKRYHSSNKSRINTQSILNKTSNNFQHQIPSFSHNTKQLRQFGLLELKTVNSPQTPSSSSDSGCSAGTSCCGGACKTTEPTTSDRVKCDPYGLNNQPLDDATLELQLEFVLENRWNFDKEKRTLNRVFSFPKATQPQKPLQASFPGAPSGPRHGPGACFTFLQAISNISTNNDHFPYNNEVIPRKSEVVVSLKTVGRPGLTNADIHLAVSFDGFYKANMEVKLQQQQV